MPNTPQFPPPIETLAEYLDYAKIPVPKKLTARQARVLMFTALGYTDAEISAKLHIGYETVRDEMDRGRDLTGLRRKTALAVWAFVHYRALYKLSETPANAYLRQKSCPSSTQNVSSVFRTSGVRHAAEKRAALFVPPGSQSSTPAAV